MKLSVVIPTYNRRQSLYLTLEGLGHQTFPYEDFEVVVVSDGSTDGTAEMLAEYAPAAPYRLRALTQANGGPSTARNRGLREAQHEIIVFLDDDVEPLPEFLRRHASHHAEDEKVVVLGPMSPDPARSSEEPAWIAWEHAKLQQTYNLFRPGGMHAGHGAGPMHFYSGNASVRRKWLMAAGGFDVTFTRQEDVELAVRLERDSGVRFVFDFAADSLHRPQRTFESWLRIPSSYGRLDAQRVRSGLLSREAIQANIRKRSLATRILACICLAFPALLPHVIDFFGRTAAALYGRGFTHPALAALSGLYNTCYVQSYYSPADDVVLRSAL